MVCDALYLHIPFCRSKCPYCDFYSVPAEEEAMEVYTDALCRAIRQAPFSIAPLDTVYFGGGTPSALGGRRLVRVLEEAVCRFGVTQDAEITVECNPCSATPEMLRLLRAAGVNRLSMGMQSGNERILKRLGRVHSRAQMVQAAEDMMRVGFDNITLDLMLCTPNQTLKDIQDDVKLCSSLGASHVSAYLLKLEPGTPFAKDDAVAADCPDEETQADLYLGAIDALRSEGYAQYEISNFCRNNKISTHNYKYWDGQAYLGLGPSAHSFIDGRRFYLKSDIQEFCTNIHPFSTLVEDGCGGDLEEYLMLRLRLNAGVIWRETAARYPAFDPTKICKKARPLATGGLVVLEETGLRLTPQGMLLSNAVTGALLD